MTSEDTVVLDERGTLHWMLDTSYREELKKDWALQITADQLGRPISIISNNTELLEMIQPTMTTHEGEKNMWNEKIAEQAQRKPIKTNNPEAGSGYYSIVFETRDDDQIEADEVRGRTLTGIPAAKTVAR